MDPLAQDERISAYLDGELPAEERARFEEELAGNSELRQLVEELRTVRESMLALPRHRLEDDFAERVLRRAERQMLTGQPIRAAAAAPPPVAVGDVTPAAQRELAPASATGRHWRSRRPWVWSGIALSVAAVLAAYDHWGPKENRIAMNGARTANTQDAKSPQRLPTGQLADGTDRSARNGESLIERSRQGQGLGRAASDKLAKDESDSRPAPVSAAAAGPWKKEAEGHSPINAPAASGVAAARSPAAPMPTGAPAAPSLAGTPSLSIAPSSEKADKGVVTKDAIAAPGALHSSGSGAGESANLDLAESAPAEKSDSVSADRPVARRLANAGRLNSTAGAAIETQAEAKQLEAINRIASGRASAGKVMIVKCAAAPDVPREVFRRMLAKRGIEFRDAPLAGSTIAVSPADTESDKSGGRAPQFAAKSSPPSLPQAASAPVASGAAGGRGAAKSALGGQPAARQAAAKPQSVPAADELGSALAGDGKELTKDDRPQATSTPADNMAVFYVEGTPEQVLGLVSDLRSQPVVYRSLAVDGQTASPLRKGAAKRADAPANPVAAEAANQAGAAPADPTRQRAAAGGELGQAGPGAAWAVQLAQPPSLVLEQLKQDKTEIRGEFGKEKAPTAKTLRDQAREPAQRPAAPEPPRMRTVIMFRLTPDEGK